MLSKLHRLPAQYIPEVLRRGIHIRDGALEFVYKKTVIPSRFAFIVSSKVDKRAVGRNRSKRLIREAIAHVLPNIQKNVDGVFIVRGRLPDTIGEVEEVVRKILSSI